MGLSNGVSVRYRQGCHIHDAAHRGAGRQDVDRFGCAQKNGANGNIAASSCFQEVVGNIGRINIGADQEVGIALQSAIGH